MVINADFIDWGVEIAIIYLFIIFFYKKIGGGEGSGWNI